MSPKHWIPYAALLGCALAGCSPAKQDDAESDDGEDIQATSDRTEGDVVTDTTSSSSGDEQPVVLELGEIRELDTSTDGGVSIDLATPNGTETFIVVLMDNAWEVDEEHSYETRISPSPLPPPNAVVQPLHEPPLTRCQSPTHGAKLPPRGTTPPPGIGQNRVFQVNDATFTAAIEVNAECVYVGGTLAIWLDRTTTVPAPAAIDETMLAPIAAGFEDTVLPRHRQVFGQESDIDGDGLVHLLFTPIVTALNVTAYVDTCDLAARPGCLISNGMEIVYVAPPDQIPNPMMASVSSILAVLAHETQHNIFFYRKFMLNHQEQLAENPYLAEAFSSMAEDLSGYGNGTFYVWASALTSLEAVSGPDLIDPSVQMYIADRDIPLRGAAYLLLRYLFEQMGGNEFEKGNILIDEGGIAFLQALVSSKELGQTNLEQQIGRPIGDVLFDWYTTLAVSNRKAEDGSALNSDPQFNYQPATEDLDTRSSTGKPERHGVDLFAMNPMTGQNLSGPPMTPIGHADGKLRPGGVEYLRVVASEPGGRLAIVFKPEAGVTLRGRIVREI
ncbi:MAG: hypothetical protein MUC50_13885 [Myxococcota bacterium]|nr:hypothetical protein [Myxococcota bacterium]